MLNAFHVLFEDTFRELEFKASLLRGQLERWLVAARKFVDQKLLPPNRMETALRHDQLVLGPAIILLGSSAEQFDTALRRNLQSGGKIRLAATVELPVARFPRSWSLLALDYQRCKPVSFASSEKLAAYFRAARCLQMIPFVAPVIPNLMRLSFFGLRLYGPISTRFRIRFTSSVRPTT
ncbi:MAG: hypothetical protein IPP19_12050 [Verrucomicrobia bacterium]|nr:hypothetical protein [Verrucomicrobiota bacterium]